MSTLDHSSHKKFYDYYAEASQSPATLQRIRALRDCVFRVSARVGLDNKVLEVADIGCGAGTQSFMWAELGHNVHGLDVNEPLIELARQRALNEKNTSVFEVGSATQLPWADSSMDVCLLLELLEHVANWEACLNECSRVLRPGGILLLTTSNRLCPIQEEFNLPLYSWYPKRIKRHFEKLAVTTRPDLANYAKYPAVNWFTFHGLSRVMGSHGFFCLDRFDLMDLSTKGRFENFVARVIQHSYFLRRLGQITTPSLILLGVKGSGA